MAEGNSGGSGGPSTKRRCRFLPEELQQEVLLRLPIKSLTRFESVCKRWLFMFKSHRFIELYGRRRPIQLSNSNYSLEPHTIRTADVAKMVPGLADTSNRCMVWVWGPLSNSIYCLASHHSKEYRIRLSLLTLKIALVNPATHHYKFTNPFPRRFHDLLSHISSKRCRLHLGFGYVNVEEKDYRVVVFITYNYGGAQISYLVLVYSVLRGVWKKIVDYEPRSGRRNAGRRKAPEAFNMQGRRIIYIPFPFLVCPQRFFEGCYHWMVGCEDQLWRVLSFNFADQSFKLIGGPPTHLDPDIDEPFSMVAEVCVLHDRLATIHLFDAVSWDIFARRKTIQVDVWMMMEYGLEESWTRIYTMNPNFDCLIGRIYGIHYQPLKSGGICIERLFFKDTLKKQTVSWDDAGYELLDNNYASKVCWNAPGFSSYTESLERL